MVGKDDGDCRFSEQSERFSAGSGSKNQITFPLKHSFADSEIGFVVLYAEDGSLSEVVTDGTFDG